MKRVAASLGLVMACTGLAFLAYVNYDAIVGAFGSGPPYYGQTTNMDKWRNPLPLLLGIDVVSTAVAWFVVRWAMKQWR